MVKEVIVTLDIPYGLTWEDTLEVNMGTYNAKISLERHFVQDGSFGSFNNAEFERDRLGKSSFTRARCFLKPIEHTENADEIDKYVEMAVSVVNRMLYVYRNTSDQFHVDKLRKVDFLDIKVELLKENGGATMALVALFPSALTLARQTGKPKAEVKAILKNNFNFPEWKAALNNAKNRLDLEDYQEATIQANIALEGFLYTHIYERLEKVVPQSEISQAIQNDSPCDTCSLNDGSLSIPHVEPRPASIYKVAKYMHSKVPIADMSNTKLIALIKEVNQYRNDIVHGRNPNIVRKDAEQAVEALERFIGLALKVTNNQIRLYKNTQLENLSNGIS